MAARRILVCGGRDFADAQQVEEVLSQHFTPEDILVHGAARGADRLASQWATRQRITQEAYPADWERYGKSAGAIRNTQMLKSGIDLVIAFAGGRGTAHMISVARRAGVLVEEI